MTQNAINGNTIFVQTVTASSGLRQVCTTDLPFDNTIPQNDEGDEVLSVTITPSYATSNLLISFVSGNRTSGSSTAALFQDSTAGALAAIGAGNANTSVMYLEHFMTAGTTSATTFKIRLGGPANDVMTNSNSTTQVYGGVSVTRLTVTEYLA